jgi:hypothetical protein
MPGAALVPLATWQNYYVIVGTAAATLTGLMFVVITLMAQLRVRPSSSSHIRVFNTSNLVHFAAALLIAAFLSAPWPTLWTAALLLGLASLVGVSYVLIVLWEVRHRLVGYQLVLVSLAVVHTLATHLLHRPGRSGDSASHLPGTGPVHHRGGDAAAPVHGDPQCMGCRDLHGR